MARRTDNAQAGEPHARRHGLAVKHDAQADAANAPAAPGVYVMKNADGTVIYVGKAKNLRSRVRSYFSARGDERPSVPILRDKLRTIDYIETATEHEALILEDKLIKEYQPRYNSDLKDDQRYFSIKLTVNEEFPRIMLVHQRQDDGALYFGPFPSGAHVKTMVRRLQKKYHLRRCPGPRCRADGPCLYAQIDACASPCSGAVTKAEYDGRVKQVAAFLRRMESMTV